MSNEENTRRLVLAIIDFLQTQLVSRFDLSLEDRDGLETATESLEMAYGLENSEHIQRRSLLDMFTQVSNPVSIQDKFQAEEYKSSGNTKMSQQQYQEAEEDYSRAIELDRYNAVYFCNRAGARIKLQQYFEGISDCRQALLLNPDYAKAYGRMGQAYALMNRPRRAARCYRQALELEPDNERYRNNLNVAESQAAEQPNAEMGNLLQSIFASMLGGSPRPPGSPGGIHMPGPSFMIISEPHTENQCDNNQTDQSQSTSQSADSDDQERSQEQPRDNESNQSSEEPSELDSIHLRVLFGIPLITRNDSSSPESQHDHDQEFTNRIDQRNSNDSQTDDRQNAFQRLLESRNTNRENVGIQAVHQRPSDQDHSKEEDKSKEGNLAQNVTNLTQNLMNNFFRRFSDPNSDKKTDESKTDGNQQQSVHETAVDSSGKENADTNAPQSDVSSEKSDGDSDKKRPIVNMTDISNFFRNFSKSNTEAKENLSKENRGGNDENISENSTSSENEKQGELTSPQDNKNIDENNEEAKTESSNQEPDTKKEENPEDNNKLQKEKDHTNNK
ncbi:hypothetical protein NPIL_216721 [Nephila pilipes]|uniref:SGTA homodimerisation domain-containing protein n=1 Tax=Nephila pilipes TaxID=299642 RepID=A0A8X6P2L1_NEPPI|nr:hypothetical protein NPIL_216721 [Nephila pilipes]